MKAFWFFMFLCCTKESEQCQMQIEGKMICGNDTTESIACPLNTLVHVLNVTYGRQKILRFNDSESMEDSTDVGEVKENITKTCHCVSSCRANLNVDCCLDVNNCINISYICIENIDFEECINYSMPDCLADMSTTSGQSRSASTNTVGSNITTVSSTTNSNSNSATHTSTSFESITAEVTYSSPTPSYTMISSSTIGVSVTDHPTSGLTSATASFNAANSTISNIISSAIGVTSDAVNKVITTNAETANDNNSVESALKVAILIVILIGVVILLIFGTVCCFLKTRQLYTKQDVSNQDECNDDLNSCDESATPNLNDAAERNSISINLESNESLSNTVADTDNNSTISNSENVPVEKLNVYSAVNKHRKDNDQQDENFSSKNSSKKQNVKSSSSVDCRNSNPVESSTVYVNLNPEGESAYVEVNPVFDPDYLAMNAINTNTPHDPHEYENIDQSTSSGEHKYEICLPGTDGNTAENQYQNLSYPHLGKNYENVLLDSKEKK